MLVPAVRPEVFNLSSLSVSESSSQAAQPIPWAHLMVALAGSPTLLACGRLFLLTWLCIWSNVVGSSDSTQIGRRKRGSVQIQDCICSSLHAHEISSRGAQGRRLGWNIAAVAEQISCEYLPKKNSSQNFLYWARSGRPNQHKLAHLDGEGYPVAFG